MQHFYAGLAEILEVDEAEVTPTLSLADLAWDSLAIVSTIAMVDETCDVMLSGKDLKKCLTVADIENLIEAKR